MSFRRESDVRSHFKAIAAVLDSALEMARSHLVTANVSIYDHSNRTGFDKSGMGNPIWEFEFERRQEAGSFIVKSVARIMYVESSVQAVTSWFESWWLGEVFQLGCLPTFRQEQRNSVSLDDLRGPGLLGEVRTLLDAAERSFPSSFHSAVLLRAEPEGP
jgi:hypothetical protein